MHPYLIVGLLQVICLSMGSEVIKRPLKTALGRIDDAKRSNLQLQKSDCFKLSPLIINIFIFCSTERSASEGSHLNTLEQFLNSLESRMGAVEGKTSSLEGKTSSLEGKMGTVEGEIRTVKATQGNS